MPTWILWILILLSVMLPFLRFAVNIILDITSKTLKTIKLWIDVKLSYLIYSKFKKDLKDLEENKQLPNPYNQPD